MTVSEKQQDTPRDFSLKSGERQFAPSLEGIRGDHLNRYKFGLKYVKNEGFGLDLFCGNGYGSYIVSKQNHHILSIDASSDAITFANANYSTDKVYFSNKQWPFQLPPQQFDFCFCLESIEHVNNGAKLLDAIYSALKPGGILILSTPNQDLMPFIQKEHKFHFRHYTQKESFDLLKQRKMQLIAWGGQNVYDIFGDGTHKLQNPNALVTPDVSGQFIIMIARK
jgi:2-polyprenyl-3-methyl-5-hydroxy-6-metoxy-1,4-benzoquinol methylase